jgi:prophage tail gpP-like protein
MSSAHGAPPRGAPPGAGDTLSLVVAGQQWSGWQRVAVTRAIDSIPANFDIQVTERYPLAADVSFNPGDPCQVLIGGDVVITGYVDRYIATISAQDHTVRIAGRSKSEDLVDCSAFMGSKDNPTFQVMGGTALSIAQQLAAPYGVQVSSIAGPGAQIPQFNIDFGQTPWEIIDRITRFSKLIAYDLPDGSIQMAQAGSETMASGFYQGQNVEQGQVAFSMDERFSEYEVHILSSYAFSNQAGLAATKGGFATDGGVPRFRRRYILSEQSQLGQFTAQDRATWECNRRKGRSQAVTLTCDAWRDAAGALWAINHKAPLNIPAIKLQADDWLIAAVTFQRDENGEHALITMMAPGSFDPEPIGDLSIVLLKDLNRNNPTQVQPKTAPDTTTGAAGVQGLPGSPSGPSARR